MRSLTSAMFCPPWQARKAITMEKDQYYYLNLSPCRRVLNSRCLQLLIGRRNIRSHRPNETAGARCVRLLALASHVRCDTSLYVYS